MSSITVNKFTGQEVLPVTSDTSTNIIQGIQAPSELGITEYSSINPKYSLSRKDYADAAAKIGCDIDSIKAIAKVETGGRSGWLDSKRCIILFEGHIFWQELKAAGINPYRYSKQYPDVLYPYWTSKYYKGGSNEYVRLAKAERISKEAALKSASYGMFQILGKNYGECGIKDVISFVRLMNTSSHWQLQLFVNYIVKRNLAKYMKNHQWDNFAYYYNGPSYQKNNYAKRISQEYIKLKKG